MRAAKTALERFEEKIERIPFSGCWLWTAASTRGYGYFRDTNRAKYAHRVSYELFRGPIPKDLWVLHRCDVKLCVNPDHLFLGSHKDNTEDMMSKGRQQRSQGENASRTKLTEQEVLSIHASMENAVSLSKKFSVTKQHIGYIKAEKTWRHLWA